MRRSLEVHVNRGDHQAVSTRTKRFAPSGPFDLHLTNHGAGVHVHVAVTGDLEIADEGFDGNPFLEADATLDLPVTVTTDLRPASGTVEVETGYGRNRVSVDVDVVDPDATAGEVSSAPDSSGEATTGPGQSGTDTVGSTGDVGRSRAATGGVPAVVADAATAVTGATAALVTAVRSTVRGLRTGAPGTSRPDDEASSRPSPPSADLGTVLLLALAVLALVAAGVAFAAFSGPVVAVGVVIVVATVLGAGVYLLVG